MKKILLTAATAALISASSAAYADTALDTVYVKINGNWSRLAKFQGLKSKNDASIGVGVGYYVMDNARFDLTFDHYFDPSHKGSGEYNRPAIAAVPAVIANPAAVPPIVGVPAVAAIPAAVNKYDVKAKGNVNVLMINGYMDLGTLDAFKFFVGAGIGVAQVKAKVTVTATTAGFDDNGKVINVGDSESAKSKQSHNLALAGYIGAAYEVAPGITAELAYSYKDMGKSKKKYGKVHYRGHHVGAGIRFDI